VFRRNCGATPSGVREDHALIAINQGRQMLAD
jgi:hypothetical protein